jgi:3-oxoacyl-[acyl-carrier protein] reductase
VDLGLRGRRALVTASSSGLGRSIADGLAAEGANLVLFARSEAKLQAVAREIADRHGVDVVAQPGSMLDVTDVQRLAATLGELGGPDIAVLVTGRPPTPLRETLRETESQRWDEAYQNQLAAVVQVVNGVVPLMLGRGWGRVIAITSAHAKQPMVGHALSQVFRAAVSAYMKGLATELGPEGITVNCVAPALIDTSHRTGAAAYTDSQTAHRRGLTPLGRLGTQEELSGVVSFLASQQAGFVTGSTVAVEGGMVGALF